MSRRRIVPDDLYSLRLTGSPVIVGDEIVAVIETIDRDAAAYRHRLGAFPLTTGIEIPRTEPRWITDAGAWSDTAPAASADGRIAFLSTRSGERRVCLSTPTGVWSFGDVDGPVSAFAWLDIDHVVAHVERPDPATAENAPVEIDWLHYKSDGRMTFREPTSELWILGTDGSSVLLHRSPGRISHLQVVADRIVTVVDARHSDELEPGTEIRSRTLGHDVVDEGDLVWAVRAPVKGLVATARTGRLVAVSSGVAGQSVSPPRLWLLDGEGGARELLTDEVDCARSIFSDSRPLGSATLLQPVDGCDDVLYLDTVEERQVVARLELSTGQSRVVSPAGWSVSDFSASDGRRVGLCLESATYPVELFRAGIDAEIRPIQISRLNDLGARMVAAPERVEIAAADGQIITCLVYRPAGDEYDDPQVLIRVHGGPHAAFGDTFDLETQVEVSAGFVVLMPNMRGSAGRGPEYRALSIGEWGRSDFADLQAVSDWAVDVGLCRADGLHLAGGSYGGYLINWALTRTDRYRSAISERSVSNLLSKWGTSDNGFTTNRFEFAGLDVLDESAVELLDRSPLRHAAKITTPLLLMHGESDHRCPIEQSEQLFIALRRQRRECKFVRFSGASHGFASSGRPDHRARRLELILAWLTSHGPATAVTVQGRAPRSQHVRSPSRPPRHS